MTKTLKDAKAGDVVTLRGVVNRVNPQDGSACVYFGGDAEHNYIDLDIPPENIVSIEPAPLKVSDRVSSRAGGRIGEILAIHGGLAWVLFDDDDPWTLDLSDLERAP